MIDILQETLCDYFPDDTLTSCCFLTRAINRKVSYYWFKRFEIIPYDGFQTPSAGFRIRGHKGYAVLSLCPFFTDYKPTQTLFCALSRSRDETVSELESIGRFTSLHPIQSLTLYVQGDYLSDIVPLLSQHCRCPDLSVVGDFIYREGPKLRRRHFKDQSWDHLTSLSASSPILFNPYGRHITRRMMSSQHLRDLCLHDKTLSSRGWTLLLGRVTIPNLTIFKVNGRVPMDSLCSFLARHTRVEDLTLGTSIHSRSCQSKIVVLPNLLSLHTPVRLALPFLRVNTTIARLNFRKDPQSTVRDIREALLLLVGTAVYHLTLSVNAEVMEALSAPHIPVCLRLVEILSLSAVGNFTHPMLVSVAFVSSLRRTHRGCRTLSRISSLLYLGSIYSSLLNPKM